MPSPKAIVPTKTVEVGSVLVDKKTCYACAHSYMEPGDGVLICGHIDMGIVGRYIRSEPLDHCPDFSKFEQHPGRNPDGSLKHYRPR